MVTIPITTDFFHSRVLSLLSSTQTHAASADGEANSTAANPPLRLNVPPLSPVDTDLAPDESMSQIIATTSLWIDLCSPDPLVANVSKQVLILEIAFAAFCGVSYVLVPGPRLHHQSMQTTGLLQYARAIQEALAVGTYMQVKIWFPMIDHPENEVTRMGDLAPFARSAYVEDNEGDEVPGLDLYGTWDAWNVIRSFCKYHTRLCIGKRSSYSIQLNHSDMLLESPHTHCFWSLVCIFFSADSKENSPHASQTSATSQHTNEVVFGASQANHD